MEQPVKHSPAKFVLVAMANESRDGETVWMAVATLSEATAQDRKTVIQNVGRLITYGYIEDTGERRGTTKQVIVYRFKTPEIGTLQQSQKRDASTVKSPEIGTVEDVETVPVFPTKTPNSPSKDSQNSLQRVPILGHEPVTPVSEPVSEPVNLSLCERDSFAEFWAAYPTKVAKPQCLAKWKSKALEKFAQTILADVAAKVANDRRWADGFIPNPLTYLNQERWNDPVQPKGVAKPAPNGKPPIAQRFSDKTYHGTPDDELPDFLRTGTH